MDRYYFIKLITTWDYPYGKNPFAKNIDSGLASTVCTYAEAFSSTRDLIGDSIIEEYLRSYD